ncbi:MAG: HU family DNA-binding protein [Candidatus Baltobacteraceae bacterium]
MTKAEIADSLSSEEQLSKRQSARIVELIFNECRSALEKGERVTLPPFGTFVVRARKAREGRNPKTGDAINIPARKVVAFVAAKGLKDAVSGNARGKKRKKEGRKA